jgi:hypothetical protein
MALAAVVMSSQALHDGFEVLRWEDGGIGPGAAGPFVIGGGPGRAGRFRRGRPDATEVAWAGRRGRARCQRGNSPLEHHRCHSLAPGNGARGTAAWSDIRPVASGLHADAVCGYPAGPRRDGSGGVAVGTMPAIMTLVSGPLYGALGPQAFWVNGAALRCCIADRIRDARDFDQCVRVDSDRADASVVACQSPP